MQVLDQADLDLVELAPAVAALTELHEAGRSTVPARQSALPAWSAVHGLAMLTIHGRVDDVDSAIRDVTRTILRSLEPR